jgi:hypothetical protein
MNFQQGADLDRRCDCSRYEKALVASMSQRVNVSGDDVPSLSQFLMGKFHLNIISVARCSKSQTNAVQCWTLSSVALSGDHAVCLVTMFKKPAFNVCFFSGSSPTHRPANHPAHPTSAVCRATPAASCETPPPASDRNPSLSGHPHRPRFCR